jgi:hypothetical protein
MFGHQIIHPNQHQARKREIIILTRGNNYSVQQNCPVASTTMQDGGAGP